MTTAIRVKIDLEQVKSKYSSRNLKRVNDILGEQVQNDMFPYVPKGQTKRLSQGRYNPGTKTVDYRMPYAHRQFIGGQGWKYTTPGTGPGWDLKAKARHLNSWRSLVAKSLTK